ncbi:uncharacterized protein EKO05_0000323 [Ascochyta rabiei]|uniref:Uncharacterized protein n=1 Tax=Didymella rabiei TaxID=5454 RepID=A0A162VE29_DIDRA|nr:uncharacterized protein EKO05_0000323 [Ascochyta rabiei]KZM18394.1 hypothetical protein ST47_g10473 [Ascochyta rabiei]UPX09638.1 hypothetical protein EKO05_0000323 [Ascochyta rabiei]
MSSKTAPYEGTTSRAQAQQRAPLPEAEDVPIPTYAEANGYAPPPGPPPATASNVTPRTEVALPPAADELPGYDTIDPKNTTFLLYSTFIHTPNGPAYQLSSALNSNNSPLRIRRLQAAEIPLAHELPIRFDRSQTLYEIQDPPFRDNEYYMVGKKPHCHGGALQLTFGWKTWHIRHIAGPNSAPSEIMTCKKVASGGGLFGKGKAKDGVVVKDGLTEPFEWKDTNGRLLATEGLQLLAGGVVPTLHLSADLDSMWRELMISFWMARLWATFR